MIEITIDNQKCSVEKGTTILEAAKSLGVKIPTLCYHEALPPDGNCRLCQVEVEERGRRKLVIACMYPVRGPIAVFTDTEKVRKARKFIIQLLLNRSPEAPVLKELASEYGVEPLDERFGKDRDLCIRCTRCVRACAILGNNCLSMVMRGWEREPSSAFREAPPDCIGCGACAEVCPTGMIIMDEHDSIREIWGRKFELVACERCGEFFATREQLEKASEEPKADDLNICPRCRKRLEAERIRIT